MWEWLSLLTFWYKTSLCNSKAVQVLAGSLLPQFPMVLGIQDYVASVVRFYNIHLGPAVTLIFLYLDWQDGSSGKDTTKPEILNSILQTHMEEEGSSKLSSGLLYAPLMHAHIHKRNIRNKCDISFLWWSSGWSTFCIIWILKNLECFHYSLFELPSVLTKHVTWVFLCTFVL